jgi:flotillin
MDHALRYLMVERNMYQDLAESNAKALQGLSPKISLWNTGGSAADGGKGGFGGLGGIMQSLPPLVDTIEDQTGLQPPKWMFSGRKGQDQDTEGVSVDVPSKKDASA